MQIAVFKFRFLICLNLLSTLVISKSPSSEQCHHQHHQQKPDDFPPPLPPPPPPEQVPPRFIKAGKGDFEESQRRYAATLDWRRRENIDTILREPFPDFFLIKEHYPHYYHLTGYRGEPVYYEQPAKTNLKALAEQGIGYQQLVRHYSMITEYQWQILNRNDDMQSIFVVDLEGIRLSDFVGDTVKFVKEASALAAQHYPERAGKVFVINVPRWFQLIWNVVKPIVDEATLSKIFILRGREEILQQLSQHVPIENIPPEYGGRSCARLGESPEEQQLADLMKHNLFLNQRQLGICPGCNHDYPVTAWPCRFCAFVIARSY